MAWVALDRSIRSAREFGLDAPVERWVRVRDEIHERVCRLGFNPQLNSFVQTFESDLLDASLLMIPLVGFLPPHDPRVLGTIAAVEKHLCYDGFALRYHTEETRDGLPPGEGLFLPCSFWLADNYALTGDLDKAHALYQKVTALANDLGLLSEESDPHAKRLVGNFPQAFTHLSLVNTAFHLHQTEDSPVNQRRQCESRRRHSKPHV
jgi:GH15 family glucan-1,4-alpha-glucosidase